MFRDLDARVWNLNPLVTTVDGFLSPEDCAGIIGKAEGRLKPSMVRVRRTGGERSEARTNSDIMLLPDKVPDVLPVLMKIGMLMRLPVTHAEGLDVLHYAVAEEFRPHDDAIRLDVMASDPDYFSKLGGQRLYSTMIYLNEVGRGGATAFPKLGLRIEPSPGRLLIFANTQAGGRHPDPLSQHAGEPVTEGEKWAAIAWWREGPYRPRDLKGAVG